MDGWIQWERWRSKSERKLSILYARDFCSFPWVVDRTVGLIWVEKIKKENSDCKNFLLIWFLVGQLVAVGQWVGFLVNVQLI